ncbi:uncharacterized protein LOC144864558 [Branchiostoma floridae x Branchiostoma japonicum]
MEASSTTGVEDETTNTPTFTPSFPPNDGIPSTSTNRLSSHWDPNVKSTHPRDNEKTKVENPSVTATHQKDKETTKVDLVWPDPASMTTVPGKPVTSPTREQSSTDDNRDARVHDHPLTMSNQKCSQGSSNSCDEWREVSYVYDEERYSKCRKQYADESSHRKGRLCVKYVHVYSRGRAYWNHVGCCGQFRSFP